MPTDSSDFNFTTTTLNQTRARSQPVSCERPRWSEESRRPGGRRDYGCDSEAVTHALPEIFAGFAGRILVRPHLFVEIPSRLWVEKF